MIVTDKGIILIHDEVIGGSVAGKKLLYHTAICTG